MVYQLVVVLAPSRSLMAVTEQALRGGRSMCLMDRQPVALEEGRLVLRQSLSCLRTLTPRCSVRWDLVQLPSAKGGAGRLRAGSTAPRSPGRRCSRWLLGEIRRPELDTAHGRWASGRWRSSAT